MRRLAILASLALGSIALGCTSTENPPKPPGKDGTIDPEGKPEPEATPTVRAVIASVQMIEDCPRDDHAWRPPPVTPAAGAPAQAPAAQAVPASPMPPRELADADVAPGAAIDGRGPHDFVQPCTQSTMQVVLTSPSDEPSNVEIETIRLIDPKSGKEVARIRAREPAAWTGDAYQPWDQAIGPRQEVKASYVLSVPEWSEVEKTMGITSSYGTMFVLEVDVMVDRARQTVRSPEFPREQPHIVVT